MTSGRDPEPARHEPVLLMEILDFLFPATASQGGIYCDATVGLGGHARAILERSAPGGRLIGLDRDPDALAIAKGALETFGDRVTLVHAPFSQVRSVLDELGAIPVDGILVDLGVSSPQLDRAERGFSFLRSGPIDMRMDQTRGETAAELLARIDEDELGRLLRDYGEERFSGRIARHIVEARGRGELDSTGTLAAIVARAVPPGERHKNPATRTFQALRIAVNRELEELDAFLDQAVGALRPGGRLCVIAFHSLEDRMVKRRFRALAGASGATGAAGASGAAGAAGAAGVTSATGAAGERPRLRILTKHVVVASEAERERNPRARSAKMRAAERVA
jgi:16S rRNA (cytosine1402-N4)-methyltransferase